jgi:sulfate permease, SulP family
MLTLIGLLRLGSLIRYIPHPVTVGFTCGIAVTIFASQIKDLAGLKLPAAEPGPLLPKLAALAQALPTVSPAATAVGLGSVGLIFLLRRLLPNWPGILIAVALASLAAWLFHLPVQTIASRFGQFPADMPSPGWPSVTLPTVLEVLPTALSFTLLGAVESLMSAKVADGMTGRKHRYNMEVVAQVIANIASALFGGISVTGTIARTATNIRAGACSPVSGMAHALFVPDFHVGRFTAGRLHSAVGAGRSARRGVLEHGGKGRVRSAVA